MSIEKTRSYNSESRQAKAAETRLRILEAARKLFRTEGFEAITIEKIAKSAKVSAPTVYGLFQSKRGVLHAVLDEAIAGQEYDAILQDVKQSKSAEATLTNAAKIARRMYDIERKEIDLFRSASVLGPEFKALEKEREDRRYKRQEESTKLLAQEKAFKKELSVTKVRDVLWALTGRDIYRMLVVEQGWTSADYELWLRELLIKTLIR